MGISAEDYHSKTSYGRFDLGGHRLDWHAQPDVFKRYAGLDTVQLPAVPDLPQIPLASLFRPDDVGDVSDPTLDADLLSRVVMLTHALTAKSRYGGQEFFYRSVASAGALYPFELYLAVMDVPGIGPGLYHHDVRTQALTRLRDGDMGAAIPSMPAQAPETPPGVVFFFTAIFFRSSWKYRDRAYRYHLLDTGHLIENFALAMRSAGLAYELMYDFPDDEVNSLLGVDPEREGCLAMGCAGQAARDTARTDESPLPAQAEELAEPSRVSPREQDYPLIREIHASGARQEPAASSSESMDEQLGLEAGHTMPLAPAAEWPAVTAYPDAVLRRRSSRNFTNSDISRDEMAALVEALCSEPEGHTRAGGQTRGSISAGFLAERVDTLAKGFYLLNREDMTISQCSSGKMVESMTSVCLGQGWLSRSAVHFVFLANLAVLDERYGPRGYRYAMLSAGCLGQRLYVAATALGLGCCGIGAFFDDEAARLLGLHSATRMLYLVAVGPLKKRSLG